MSGTIYQMAERMTRHLAAAGLETTDVEGSELSRSCYFQVTVDGDQLKVRVSDHTLPPSYAALNGAAAYEAGTHPDARHWLDAVGLILERADAAPAPATRRAMTAKANRDAAEAAKRAEQEARRDAAAKGLADEAAQVDAVMRQRGLDHLTGRSRKRARQKIRKELGLFVSGHRGLPKP